MVSDCDSWKSRCFECDTSSNTPRSRSHEVFVAERAKPLGRAIGVPALSRDEQFMKFAAQNEERDDLIASKPEKFILPGNNDLPTTGSTSDHQPSDMNKCGNS